MVRAVSRTEPRLRKNYQSSAPQSGIRTSIGGSQHASEVWPVIHGINAGKDIYAPPRHLCDGTSPTPDNVTYGRNVTYAAPSSTCLLTAVSCPPMIATSSGRLCVMAIT